jgi:GTPase SAR1 family protein
VNESSLLDSEVCLENEYALLTRHKATAVVLTMLKISHFKGDSNIELMKEFVNA